jgi:hypothetical protein
VTISRARCFVCLVCAEVADHRGRTIEGMRLLSTRTLVEYNHG